MAQAGLLIAHWQAQVAKHCPALAVGSGLAAVALVGWNAWPPSGWAFVALIAWAAFPAWLFHASSRVALRESAIGVLFSVLAPSALLGGIVLLAWHTLTRGRFEFPLAVVAVPLGQLAIALPFVLNTSTDTKLKASAAGEDGN